MPLLGQGDGSNDQALTGVLVPLPAAVIDTISD